MEDDVSLQAALVRLVKSFGYNSRGFTSAEDLIGSEATRDCAVLITDVRLPGLSGIDLTSWMKGRFPRTPVIVITAREDGDMRSRAEACGAFCFLKKPVDAHQLSRLLGDTLEVQ